MEDLFDKFEFFETEQTKNKVFEILNGGKQTKKNENHWFFHVFPNEARGRRPKAQQKGGRALR